MKNDEFESAKMLYKPASDATGTPSCEASDARRWRIMVALWERMGQLFGPQWESWYGTVETQTIRSWQRSLAEFSEEELAGAVKACESWEASFLPTYPQFRALCMAARGKLRPNWTDERVERDVTLAQLAKPKPGDSTVAQREKARIRGILAGAEAETKAESYHHLQLHRRWGPL